MAANLVVADTSASAIISASGFDRAQVELVKSTVAIGATDMELALFLQTAKHRGLDVFARQLHFVKRKQSRKNDRGQWEDVYVGTMQTGIDGFRLIADRTGKYDGQDEPDFEYEQDGKTLRRASVRVYRKDIPRPFVGTAYWREYAEIDQNGVPRAMWKRMPHVMLGKCAEAIALRKAFPENLSGLYSDDEMPTFEGEVVERDPVPQPTGTVTRMPDRAQRTDPLPADPPSSSEEIPPADADLATLRTWIGRRLAFRTKSWTADHMATVCGEVGRALGLAEGDVTPKNLGEHLPRYRDAIASELIARSGPQSASPGKTGAVPAQAGETNDVPPAAGVLVSRFLAEHKVADNDEDLQETCGRITGDSEKGVRYDWMRLDPDELTALLAELQAWSFDAGDDEALL